MRGRNAVLFRYLAYTSSKYHVPLCAVAFITSLPILNISMWALALIPFGVSATLTSYLVLRELTDSGGIEALQTYGISAREFAWPFAFCSAAPLALGVVAALALDRTGLAVSVATLTTIAVATLVALAFQRAWKVR